MYVYILVQTQTAEYGGEKVPLDFIVAAYDNKAVAEAACADMTQHEQNKLEPSGITYKVVKTIFLQSADRGNTIMFE